ncbi:MAG: D-cysteine desulfhydrase family protein [Candidatus Rokubacteria bacterium]|nr:D-cysteine desulfhydrase family protein [Candidatus Rokubacteria bacterium]
MTFAPPREALAALPTPLHELPRLGAALGGPRILIKRDDLAGFALGGNKVRKLEYFLADARARGADTLITCGGVQSNHCRVTAAAAARAGMSCLLVLSGSRPERLTGNALLDQLFGAELVFVASRAERAARMEALAGELGAKGRLPYVIPLGGSTPLGAYGYVEAAREFAAECRALGVSVSTIVHASSSGGTQAGLVVGCLAAGLSTRVIGISADETREDLSRMVVDLAVPLAERLGLPALGKEAIEVADEYVGEGYASPTPASREATRLFARHEGIVLDGTYSAKAAAGLIDLVRRGRWSRKDTVCFWHTGAQASLSEALPA